MIEIIKKNKDIVLYIIFGIATTLVNWIVYSICISLVHIEMTASNAIAWVVAVLFAFITNKIIVFKSLDKSFAVIAKEFLAFIASRGVTGVMEIFLPTLIFKIGLNQELFGIKGFFAKALVNIIVIILNYIFSKLIFLKNSKSKK